MCLYSFIRSHQWQGGKILTRILFKKLKALIHIFNCNLLKSIRSILFAMKFNSFLLIINVLFLNLFLFWKLLQMPPPLDPFHLLPLPSMPSLHCGLSIGRASTHISSLVSPCPAPILPLKYISLLFASMSLGLPCLSIYFVH